MWSQQPLDATPRPASSRSCGSPPRPTGSASAWSSPRPDPETALYRPVVPRGIRHVWWLRRRFPGRLAGHPGWPGHARISSNTGLTRAAARQRECRWLVPRLPQVKLIVGPLGGDAAGLPPSWAAGLRGPAPPAVPRPPPPPGRPLPGSPPAAPLRGGPAPPAPGGGGGPAGGSELSPWSSWAMLSFQSSPAAGPGNCRRAVRGWPLNLATALRSQRRLLPRDWCSVPGEELPGGPVVRQQRQPDRARRGLGRVTVTGGGGGIEVGPAQAGCERIHLDAVICGQRVQCCLGRPVGSLGAPGRELRPGSPGQRSGAAGDVHDPRVRRPPERRQEGVGHRDDPEDVRLVDTVKGVDVLSVRWLAGAGAAGIVDQDGQRVDLARIVIDGRGVGAIDDDQPGVAADLLDGALSAHGIARADVNGEAGAGELARDLLAHTLVGTGDDCD